MPEQEEKQRGHSWFTVTLAILAFIAICFFAIMGYGLPSNKAFSNNSYYEGIAGSEEDPKVVYEKIYKNTFAIAAACNTTMEFASNPTLAANSYYWVVDGQELTGDILSLNSMDGGYTVYPFASASSKNIVAPARSYFVNSNTAQYEDGIIEIRIRLGSEYELRFRDVESWWCHMDKEEHDRHTVVIGNGGIQEECVAGYVIGLAKEETSIELYKINEDNTYVQLKISELFLPDSSSDS